MRHAIAFLLVLLVPAAILADPAIGFFFDAEASVNTLDDPLPMVAMDGYVFAVGFECYVTAAEFKVTYPAAMIWTGEEFTASLSMGQTTSGVSLSFWPPLNGWVPGYNLMATVHFILTGDCDAIGNDVPIVVGPHPDTGLVQAAMWPDNVLFDAVGLTATICPSSIGVEEESWGAIKSMLK
ncbi:MAG: hypothetical protein JW876_07845 [Candidatus Krumholzibacteriota bacterium]|nr:hypothetical protein [Candidatus Krumholzibacteriota bacterium]